MSPNPTFEKRTKIQYKKSTNEETLLWKFDMDVKRWQRKKKRIGSPVVSVVKPKYRAVK
jgi:hypothetical protein